MAYLTINGVPIPVELEDSEKERIEAVDAGRSIDNTYVSRQLGDSKFDVPLRTRLMKPAQFATVLAAMDSAPPQTAAGDLMGGVSVPCVVEVRRIADMSYAEGKRHRIAFVLHEE